MKFSKVGEHTIKCVISEDEIYDLGYTMDEIMSNGERTQEFMNQIFDMAEQEFGTKFEMGIKTVKADFMADHTLSLTFSNHPVPEGMMENIKGIMDGLMNSVSQKAEEAAKAKQQEEEEPAAPESAAMVAFERFDVLLRFVRLMECLPTPPSQLYKFEDVYYLEMDLSGYTQPQLKTLSVLTDEYADNILAGVKRRAFFLEHARIIIKENAIEQLTQL